MNTDPEIMIFENAYSNKPASSLPLSAVLEDICTGEYLEDINRLRKILANGKKNDYDKEKTQLPGYTFSVGGFDGKRKISAVKKRTGIVVADIDHLNGKHQTEFNKIIKDPHIAFAFISPSGDGIKAGVFYTGIGDEDDHKRAWGHLAEYFRQHFDLEIDKACKDSTRLCFTSYDPNLHHNPKPKTLDTPPKPPPEVPKLSKKFSSDDSKHSQNKLQLCIDIITAAPPGEQHHARIKAARLAGGYVAGNLFSYNDAYNALTEALSGRVNDYKKACKDIEDGLKNGMATPIYKDTREKIKGKKYPHHIASVAKKYAKEYNADPGLLAELLKSAFKKARKKPTTEKAEKIFAEMGFKFSLNVCNDGIYCNGEPISDVVESRIINKTRDQYINLTEGDIKHIIKGIAHKYRFHPVKRWLKSLEYDGDKHIDKLCNKIETSDPDIQYKDGTSARAHNIFIRKWFIGAVAKVHNSIKNPGLNAQNPAIVLISDQKCGKSTFVRWLCSGVPELFKEGPLLGNQKDLLKSLITCFIWEISELDATTRKADVAAIKDFITKMEVNERFSYGHHPITKPSMASFIGTVNDDVGFLTDPTGNRRFTCIKIDKMTWDYVDMDIAQIWAEAYQLYLAGETHTYNAEETAYQNSRNTEHMTEIPLQDICSTYFEHTGNDEDRLTYTGIIEHLKANGYEMPIMGSRITSDVKRVFTEMGCTRKKTKGVYKYVGVKVCCPENTPF